MSIWKKLYKAYKDKNCQEFENLWKQLTNEDKSSPYFSYYASLKTKLCPQSNKKGKILLKGKTIKCPSCGSHLTLSDYNKEQIKKLKNGTKQVIFVCNYCGNKFSYSKTPFKTIFSNYSIGDEITLKGKKYKLAGAVKYKGTYNEIGELGYIGGLSYSLEYIEWLAYNKKGEIFYISESRAKYSYGTYDELEISKKVNFPFVIKNIDNSFIETDKGKKFIDEIDNVKVVSLIGELNKSYKIGETIKLRKFSQYNLEEEKGDNSIERNLYEITEKENYGNINEPKLSTKGYLLSFLILLLILAIILCPFFIITGFSMFYLYTEAKNKTGKGIILIISIIILLTAIFYCINFGGILLPEGSSYSSWGGSSWGGGK